MNRNLKHDYKCINYTIVLKFFFQTNIFVILNFILKEFVRVEN